MSISPRSDSDNSFNVEELLQFQLRCQELKKEKDVLRNSQSQSLGLIRRLEQHVKSLSEAWEEDQRHIQKLERELMNCSQEIEYLQDQLNLRNAEFHCLEEQVRILELKLADMEDVKEQASKLREELETCNSERLFLVRKLKSKEVELQKSTLCIEKLEESVSSIALDSQCEVEGMKLDLTALEQSYFEAKKFQEESFEEIASMTDLIKEMELELQDARKAIKYLERENDELKVKFNTSEMNARMFCQRIEGWLENGDKTLSKFENKLSLSEQAVKLSISEQKSCGEVFGPLVSRLATVLTPDINSDEKMESLLNQIHDYELLVKQLKEELREEKLKAKEEAEDLTQEMAELRYQSMNMLEDERKRHACIEQASLQRIAELEAQVKKEERKFVAAVRCLQ